MNGSQVDALAERLARMEQQNRGWKLAALVALCLLGAVLVTGQAEPPQEEKKTATPGVTAAAPQSWEYEVVRFPARRPFVKDHVPLLAQEIDAAAANGWEYVGLLALEANTAGYNGLVAFRRVKK